MVKQIAILHQGCIPVYRTRFYELLNTASPHDYVVIHGDAPTGSDLMVAKEPFAFPTIRVKNREIMVRGKGIIYQPVLSAFLHERFDAAVLGHEIRYVSNLLALTTLKARRRPAIWWGFGYHKYTGDRGIGRFELFTRQASDRLKRHLLGVADGYLVYTEQGARELAAAGFTKDRIAVLRNTIDVDEQIALHQRYLAIDPNSLRRELGLQTNSLVLVYIGRFWADKRIDLLLDFVERYGDDAGGPPIEAVIVGDGAERDTLHRQAEGLDNVHFTGALDPVSDQLAAILRIASALVIPGFVGLAVNHGFAHGLPVITRDHAFHSPEVEYVRHGENGLLIPGGEQAFFDGLLAFARDKALQEKLARGALEDRKSLTIDHMVQTFDGLVSRLLQEK